MNLSVCRGVAIGLIAATVCQATAFAGRAVAAPPATNSTSFVSATDRFGKTRFAYKADGKRLSDVLKDFSASFGVPVVVDGKVEGVVSGSFDTSAQEFLDGLSRAYSLIWHFDGTALYVYPAGSIQSRIFRLKGYSQDQVFRMLDSLRLMSTRYPIRWDADHSTLLVYGPPRHVELVGLAIESLDIGAIEGNRRAIRVFPLRYASAGDHNLGSYTVPGVASVLQSVFSGGKRENPASMLAQAEKDSSRNMAPMNKAMQSIYGSTESGGKYLPDLRQGSSNGLNDDRSGKAPQPRAVRSPMDDDTDDDTPVFEADVGSNAIIVYAKGRRMEEIGGLIRSLDVPAVLVELEATIIEVATDGLSELGVDWAVSSRGSSISVGRATSGNSGGTSTSSILADAPFTVSTLIRDAGRALMANVSALEGAGRARVVSKPRVLGLANRPAYMVEKRIANVRVAGNLEANLFQIEAGTTLQITPQVTPSAGGAPPQIKMSLFIQDGNFEDTSVDKVPLLKRTEIRTEARVMEGESLLIGGISVESDSSQLSGVPGLKDVPVMGGLFRQRQQRSTRTERLFLITPRVVSSAPASEVAAAGAADTRAPDVVLSLPNPPPAKASQPSPAASAAGAPAPGARPHPALPSPVAVDGAQTVMEEMPDNAAPAGQPSAGTPSLTPARTQARATNWGVAREPAPVPAALPAPTPVPAPTVATAPTSPPPAERPASTEPTAVSTLRLPLRVDGAGGALPDGRRDDALEQALKRASGWPAAPEPTATGSVRPAAQGAVTAPSRDDGRGTYSTATTAAPVKAVSDATVREDLRRASPSAPSTRRLSPAEVAAERAQPPTNAVRNP